MPVTYGAFTPESASALLGQATLAIQPTLFVNSYTGSDTYNGQSPDQALGTITRALALANNGSVIGIFGVFKEQVVTRLGLQDVTIVGLANTPRQATTSGAPNGGGATWLAPASVTASMPLIRVQGQGFTLRNIYFNSADITSNGCIQPYTTGDPPTAADGAHLLIDGCILTGAKYGVFASGGTNFVRIYNTSIFGFGDSGDIAIAQTAGAGIGTCLKWEIINCKLWGNANGIVVPFNQASILNNQIDSGTQTIYLVGGTAPNRVIGNSFNIAADDFDPAGGVEGVSGDIWSNTLTNAIETGLPAN